MPVIELLAGSIFTSADSEYGKRESSIVSDIDQADALLAKLDLVSAIKVVPFDQGFGVKQQAIFLCRPGMVVRGRQDQLQPASRHHSGASGRASKD